MFYSNLSTAVTGYGVVSSNRCNTSSYINNTGARCTKVV